MINDYTPVIKHKPQVINTNKYNKNQIIKTSKKSFFKHNKIYVNKKRFTNICQPQKNKV
jgi:hypothetical protein